MSTYAHCIIWIINEKPQVKQEWRKRVTDRWTDGQTENVMKRQPRRTGGDWQVSRACFSSLVPQLFCLLYMLNKHLTPSIVHMPLISSGLPIILDLYIRAISVPLLSSSMGSSMEGHRSILGAYLTIDFLPFFINDFNYKKSIEIMWFDKWMKINKLWADEFHYS